MKEYDKYYFERYAKMILYSAFPEWKSHFTRSDRPDLQNEIDDVGIEVTSSTPPQIREVESFGARLLGEIVCSKDEQRFRGKLFLTPERVAYAYSPTKGLVDADRSAEIIAAIAHKRDKWKEYKDFSIRGVYVFTGTSLIDDEMLEKVEESEACSFFQMVFINAIDRLYYYKDGWKNIEFTNEELAEFKKSALVVD